MRKRSKNRSRTVSLRARKRRKKNLIHQNILRIEETGYRLSVTSDEIPTRTNSHVPTELITSAKFMKQSKLKMVFSSKKTLWL